MRLLLALLVLTGPAAAAPGPAPEVGVGSSLEKLRPGDAVPPGRTVALATARGGCDAAQVAVRAREGIEALAARAGPLEGPGGERLPVQLYRVATVSLARPSGLDGAAGEWPDPLIPVEDPFFHEARRAFPVPVPAGRLQSIWVEVCAPDRAPAGSWRGELRVEDGGRVLARVPIRAEVWPFALPTRGAFPATFGLSTRLGTAALGRPGDRQLARALAAAAVRHRLTPHGLSADPPAGRCDERRCDLDWREYDAEVGPILDGTLVPGAVQGGFAEVRISARVWAGPPAALAATLAAWREHFQARGWGDRLFLYTLDEPSPKVLPELARRARAARAAGVRVFATTVPRPELDGLVDVYVPNLPELARRPAARLRGAAGPGEPDGALPWWYASCTSHGCAEVPEDGAGRRAFAAYTGWPGYEIDRPGAAARVMGWLAFRAGVAGELYYDMLQTWGRDPWTDVRAFAGNGDGTLLYPGRPERLGGTHPFPVESIRLKQIRDGLQDLELLRLAASAGQRALAGRLAAALARSPREWERDPAPYLNARRELAEAVARALARR